MQARCAAIEQTLAHFADHLLAKCLDAVRIIAVGFQLLANPAWDFCTASVGEARQLAVVGDRHDARHDRDHDAGRTYALNKTEVAVGVKEVLGDRTVGASVGLAHEVADIVFEIACLRVHLRVCRHFNMEVIAGFFANEAHQVIGIAQLTAGHPHTRRQVATQRDNTLDTCTLVLGQQATQVVLAVTDTRQVRGGRYLGFALQLQHGVDRAVTGRATGTVGAGEKIRVVGRQLASRVHQFFMSSIGLGREELEAVTTVLGHGQILGNTKAEYKPAPIRGRAWRSNQ